MSFLYNKKQLLNPMKIFFETLNKRWPCVPIYLCIHTCKLNKMAVPRRYPLNGMMIKT